MMRFRVVLMVAVLAGGCGGNPPACGPGSAASTRDSSSAPTTVPDERLELARMLSMPPYPGGRNAKEWEVVLERTKVYSDWQRDRQSTPRIDLAERDEHVARIARVLARPENRASARCLILENIQESGGWGGWARYEHRIVYGQRKAGGGDLSEIGRLGGHRVEGVKWERLDKWLELLVSKGGGNVDKKASWFENGDVTVISYFDGSRWRFANWLWFSDYRDTREIWPETPAQLPAEPKAFANLLKFLDAQLKTPNHFVSEFDELRTLADP